MSWIEDVGKEVRLDVGSLRADPDHHSWAEELEMRLGRGAAAQVMKMQHIGKLGLNRQVTTKHYKSFQILKCQKNLKALQILFSTNVNGGEDVTFPHVQNNFFPLQNIR